MATHWPPGSPVEVVGGRRAPPSRPPVVVVEGEQKGLVDQISMQPWLSLELVLWVEEEGEEMVVKEERCCRQLGGYCSLVWWTGWEGQVVWLLAAVSWTGSGSAGVPVCCT